MTTAEFRRRVEQDNIVLAAFKRERAAKPPRLTREEAHQATLAKIRRDGAAQVTKIRRELAESRRRKERVLDRLLNVELGLDGTRRRVRQGQKRDPVLERKRLQRECEHRPVLTAELMRFRAHIRELCRRLRIECRFTVEYFGQGYALHDQAAIEVPPVNGAFSYGTALHEVGHLARPCNPTHVRVKTSDLRTVCVACELAAWYWAIEHSLCWTRELHGNLADALGTYLRYATAAEAQEISLLTGRDGYRHARARHIATEGTRS